MTAQTSTNLRGRANTIRASIAGGAVTPSQVGGLLVDIVDSSDVGTVSTPALVTGSAPSAEANTAAIESAVQALSTLGGGELRLPPGVTWVSEGSALGSVCLQFGATVANVTVRGSGEGISILKLRDSGASHVINIDGATDIKILDLTIDGNRDNNTGTSWHGIRTGDSGVNGLTVERVTVQNTRGYGLGLQGGNKKRVRILNVSTYDTGADGIDFKNTGDNSEDIFIAAFSARRWGLDGTLTEQAGVDARGPCQMFGIWTSEGPADGHYIRMREGETVDPSLGGHYSTLHGFVCEGNSGALSVGLYVAAHDVDVRGGRVSDMLLGVSLAGERVSIAGVTAESCDDESFQVNVGAVDCSITDCASTSATGSGLRGRAPRMSLKGFVSKADTVSAVELEATATGAEISGIRVVGVGGATMVGVQTAAPDTRVVGGDIGSCFRGVSSTGLRTKLIGVYSHNNVDDGAIFAVGSDDSAAIACSFISNGDDGITVRCARARIVDNTFLSNTGTAIAIEAAAVDARIDLNRISLSAAALVDSGTGTRVGLLNDGLSTPYLNSSIRYLAGTGSPEGVHVAPVGSQYARTDGGAGTCLYVKESGAGNTGWVAK